MSPLRAGTATVTGVSAEALSEASEHLRAAVESGGRELPDGPAARARGVVDKVVQRTSLVGSHTVVALAGATGSGKSSLFNALAGGQVATVGARRPTTSTPTAAVWGSQPVGPLLDWLQVSRRHHVLDQQTAIGGAVGSLDGLVLLDLPDFDSRELAHRAEAERVLELTDVFVWVTDPQKYADARLHDDYIATLAQHDAVTVIVLNQVDRLTQHELEVCTSDLRRLMARDGMPDMTVIPTSATTRVGLDVLGQRLRNAVAGANAARTRLAGDTRACAAALRPAVAAREPDVGIDLNGELVTALARAAGVSTVVDAVRREHVQAAIARTGWPFTRWVHQFRPRPLHRLRLGGTDVKVEAADVRAVIGRSSLPPPTPAAKAAVDLATRRLVEAAGAGLPEPWERAVEDAARPPESDLTDVLDRAILRTSLRSRVPAWWRVVGVVQMLFALAALGGLLWYAVLWGLRWLQFPDIGAPTLWGWLPVPFLLLVGGLLAGVLLALVSRYLAGVGANRRAAEADRRLRQSIATVAEEHILAPVHEVVARHRQTREHLEAASRL